MQPVWRSLALALAVSLLVAALALFVLFRYCLPQAVRDKTPARYTIGVWEGQVAVFEGDQSFPRQVFDVAVSSLPEELRRAVQAGVPAQNDAQLSVLLEDYTG